MKTITASEIKEIADNIISQTSECSNDYDAKEITEAIIKETLEKMDIPVEDIHMIECKCKTCGCGKK